MRKLFLLFGVSLSFISCFLNAQDTWLNRAAYPGGSIYNGVAASVGGKGYLGLGYRTAPTVANNQAFYEYNPTTNTWAIKANFPIASRHLAVAFSIGTKVYVGTGNSAAIPTTAGNYSDFWEYDPATNIWTAKASLPAAARCRAVGFSANGKGYIGLGTNGLLSYNDLWEYNPATNAWTQKANFPGAARHSASVFVINNIAYVGGGLNATSIGQIDFYKYNPATNAWIAISSMPSSGYKRGAFAIGPNGYVTVGYASTVLSTITYKYASTANAWTTVLSFPSTLREAVCGFDVNGKGYIGTGLNGTAGINDLWEYTSINDIGLDTIPSVICSGATVPINFTVAGVYNSGNVFTAQLSNSIGSFTSPVNIGTLTSLTGGTISAVIPFSTASGSGYRIRIVSSNVAATGQTIGYNITINQTPAMTSGATGITCSKVPLAFGLTSNLGSNFSWVATSNANITGASTSAKTGSIITDTLVNVSTIPQNITYTVIPTAISGGCSGAPQTITITVNPAPTMTSVSSLTRCNGAAVNLTLTSNVASTFTWAAVSNTAVSGETTTTQSTGIISDVLVNTTATTQAVVYIVTPKSNGSMCTGLPQTVVINVLPAITLTSSLSVTICSGNQVNLNLAANLTSTFTWVATSNPNINGESTSLQSTNIISDLLNNLTSVPQTVTYLVTPKSTSALCTGASQNVIVTVNPMPSFTTALTKTICSGTSVGVTLNANISSSFAWIAKPNPDISGASATAQYNNYIGDILVNTTNSIQTIDYDVLPTSNLGSCAGNISTITVSVLPEPRLTSANAINVCSGSSVNLALTASVPSTFSWLAIANSNVKGASANAQSNGVINDTLVNLTSTTQTLTYNVLSTSLNGSCVGILEVITVNLFPAVKPVASITRNKLCTGDTLSLLASGGVIYKWIGPNGYTSNDQNPIIDVVALKDFGTYKVIITDANGCFDSAFVNVKGSDVPCFFIPTMFTPNGDGINDIWEIPGIRDYPNSILNVYNRWGQIIYSSEGYSTPWDGKFNGQECPTADYYYLIDLKTNDARFSGTITIKR